jgi:c-di-AMP phosphodiesterase-like protein
MDNILEKISTFAYSFKETVQHSYDCAIKMIENEIEGDFVECGVAAGAQICAMSYALQVKNANKTIYGYDSFEGIPLAGEFDTEQAGIGEITHDKFAPLNDRLVSSGITVHSMENVINNYSYVGLPTENVVFVKGWFQNTLPYNNIDKISLLRLDGDLHESTLVCLEHLYPKVSKGGIVIIDDYALTGCRVAIEQYFKSKRKKLPEFIEVQGGGGVVYFEK